MLSGNISILSIGADFWNGGGLQYINGCSPPVMTELKVGSKSLATYTYGPGNGLLQKQSFANGDSISFTYDKLGRTKTAVYSDGTVLTYVYNGEEASTA